MRMSWRTTAGGALLLAALGACSSQSPVQWSDLSVDDGATADSGVAVEFHADPRTAIRTALPSTPSGICASSLRSAPASSSGLYAAWWRPRADSSVALEAGYSSDGGRSWRIVSVDTVDRTRTGCDRPAPAIAAERDNVHIAYSLHGPEGSGVFFAHSMDRAALFHAPVSIVYGDRLTEAGIAAKGDRVLIAYVDPNTTPPQIGLAISKTEGHNFLPRIAASVGAGMKSNPGVSLSDKGDALVVAWLQYGGTDSTRRSLVTRLGRLR